MPRNVDLRNCDECQKKGIKGAQGLAAHKRAHRNRGDPLPAPQPVNPDTGPVENEPHGQPVPSSDDASQANTSTQPSTAQIPKICRICGITCQNLRAYLSHRPSHPLFANYERLRPEHIRQRANKNHAADEEREGNLIYECDEWYARFLGIYNDMANFQESNFDATFDQFAKFLFLCNMKITGAPLHPNVKYWRLRKSGKRNDNRTKQSQSSNPSRTDKRRRNKRRARYDYELAQWCWYFRRKWIVRKVMNASNDENIKCTIPMKDIQAHFTNMLGTPNEATIPEYPTSPQQLDATVSIEEVNRAIKAVNLDTSSGYDRVEIRTVKELTIGNTVKVIIDIMLATGHVPAGMTQGRTILIYKKGDKQNIANWRPITVHSILRRIIKKVLDRVLRNQLDLNSNQRGFVSGVPGCQVNSTLLNASLQIAKNTGKDCYAVFLDISRAFDNIGHTHIERCLEGQGVSSNVRRLVSSLLRNNSIRIDTGEGRSELIQVRRSVPQGGPLSPLLFNVAINHLYQEMCDQQFANQHGTKLFSDLDALSLLGFADDQLVLSSTLEGATRIVELTKKRFKEIGLDVNPDKSVAIAIVKGKLAPGTLQLNDQTTITCIDKTTTIKYLGTTVCEELVFDHAIVGDITEKLNQLLVSPLLKKEQKRSVINGYLLAMLTFPLQTAPRNKIPKQDMVILDRNIRSTIKAIIGLPTSTSNEFIYSPKNVRGLGATRCEWETLLQHYSIAKKLNDIPDQLLQRVKNWQAEMDACKTELNIDMPNESPTARQIRTALREKSYTKWCQLTGQGQGAKHFKTFTKCNTFTHGDSSLTSSEWTDAIKMSTNYAALAGVKGVESRGSDRCRHGCNEKETIAHAQGSCDYGLNLRNERHHWVKHRISSLLQEKGFQCCDEVPCKDANNTNRRVDILAFHPRVNTAYIIDPTIRYENNDDIDLIVEEEKKRIYEPCIKDLAEKFKPQYGERDYEVIGLWVGARGVVSHGLISFFERFRLDKKELLPISERVLSSTVRIVRHHIYSS